MLLIVLPLLLGCVTATFHRPHAFRLNNSPIHWYKVPDSSYEVRVDILHIINTER